MEETYGEGDLVELVGNAKIVRLTTNRLPNDHYGASLNIHNDWPENAIGAILYIHHGDIYRKVTDGELYSV